MGELGHTLRRAQSVFRSKKAIADGGLHVLARRIAILKGESLIVGIDKQLLWQIGGKERILVTQRDGEGATMAFPSKVGDIGLQVETVEARSTLRYCQRQADLKEAISICRSLSLENGLLREVSLEPTPPQRGTTHDGVADLGAINSYTTIGTGGSLYDYRIAGSVALLVWVESNLKCRPFVFLYTNNLALITKT